MSAYTEHVKKELKAGKTIKQAAASWKKIDYEKAKELIEKTDD